MTQQGFFDFAQPASPVVTMPAADQRAPCIGCGTPTGCELITINDERRVEALCFSTDRGCRALADAARRRAG